MLKEKNGEIQAVADEYGIARSNLSTKIHNSDILTQALKFAKANAASEGQ